MLSRDDQCEWHSLYARYARAHRMKKVSLVRPYNFFVSEAFVCDILLSREY